MHNALGPPAASAAFRTDTLGATPGHAEYNSIPEDRFLRGCAKNAPIITTAIVREAAALTLRLRLCSPRGKLILV